MKTKVLLLAAIGLAAGFGQGLCQDKVPLEEPKEDKVPLGEPKLEGFEKELKSLPDGVHKVKTNPDGSFKSLVVKETVEIEETLGAQKGKRLAHKEAEIECKRDLTKWLNENCLFVEGSSSTRTIITKGESVKDAAGNTVNIRKKEDKEYKVLTANHASLAAACLKGLVTLHTEVIAEGDEAGYVMVMGLSQRTIDQASLLKESLSNKGGPATSTPGATPNKSNSDRPAPEKKTSPDAEDFLK